MQVWAVANQKGGVGKTTTTLCLARNLAADARVLVVDLDPHASLTRAFGVPRQPPPIGTHEVFVAQAPSLDGLSRTTAIERLRLVAAQPALATLERRSATQPGLGMALQRALTGVSALYDHVLLDCPPTLSLLMVNALAAADCLVVPTQTDPLALHGLADMLRTADMVERSRKRPLVRAIVPTLHDARTASGQRTLEHLYAGYEGLVWSGAIPLDTRLRDARAIAGNAPLAGRGADAYAEALAWLRTRIAAPLATPAEAVAA